MESYARQTNSGVALLTSIALLAFVSVMGTAYFQYMTIETQTLQQNAQTLQVETLARSVVDLGAARLAAAKQEGAVPERLEYANLPIYLGGGDTLPKRRENLRVDADIVIEDESARINLNHAPVTLLTAALNVDDQTAQHIRRSLPTGADSEGRWLNSVGDLLVRGFVDRDTYEALNQDILTVYSVSNPAQAAGFINVNTAPPEVLSAIMGIEESRARELASQRPFESINAFIEAANASPASFNLTPGPAGLESLPDELALDSNMYRITCTYSLSEATAGDTWRERPPQKIIAVVEVSEAEGGQPRIVHWRTL